MSEDILIIRAWRDNAITVICHIGMDPFYPIDSTKSMPSFMQQAARAGFLVRASDGVAVLLSLRWS